MKKTIFSVLSLLLAGALVVSAADSKTGGTLVFGKGADARTLDPGTTAEGNSSQVCTQIFESLLAHKPGTTEIVPCLAESYSLSKDATEITFNLRPGVFFHDGTLMDADAVVFSLKRQYDKSVPFNQFGPWKGWNSKGWAATDKGPGLIKDIIKVNNMVVKVVLNRPDAPIVYNFTLYFTSIVSPTAANKFGADFKKNPVGTGPFQFVEWQKDSVVVLKRFDKYWGQKTFLDGMIFKVIPDPQARVLALAKGEVDMIEPTTPESMKIIESNPNLKFNRGESNAVGWLHLNCESGPFTNKMLRQAFAYAVNRKEILNSVYGKMGLYEKFPMPSHIWAYDNNLPDYEFSIQKAKKYIQSSGLKPPIRVNLLYLPVFRPYNPNGKKAAEILQAQLKVVGIEANLLTYDEGTYWDNVDGGKFDISMAGWAGESDPDDWLYTMFTDGYLNASRWHNKNFIDLVTKAKGVVSIAERSKLYYKAERILQEEVPVVVLGRAVEFMPMSNKVQGWKTYPNARRNFSIVYFNK